MADDAPVYTLHYFPFSVYSLMVRFGFVIGQALNPETAPKIDIKLVNLHREENLSEQYLTSINSKGQVPALTSPALSSTLDESYDIAKWLCEKQPELSPEQHRETINRLMEMIYSFHAMALVVPPEDRKEGIPNQAAAWLENSGISEPHRRALEIKSVFHDTCHNRTLDPDNIADVEEKARAFASDLEQVLSERGDASGPWIFGERPTILDAHATAMAARLIDVERNDLLPDAVQDYARGVMATPEWGKVTHGRRTIWDVSLGHVADLKPL